MAPPNSQQRLSFGNDSQQGLKIPTPKPELVREKLHEVLQELREAETFPWSPAQLRSWRIVFPTMTTWLSGNERRELREAFSRELDRWGDVAQDTDGE